MTLPNEGRTVAHADPARHEWWRSAVIYQIYPRSFSDSDGDGIGDLPGITDRLPHLAELGIDAIWLSPFMPSPQRDAGYDVADYRGVDPVFGTLADFDRMLARAHELGIRVIVDLVPNHSSDAHPWFQQALRDGPGSHARTRYHFRPGRGVNGAQPPNDWQSIFGGAAWSRLTEPDGTPGEWYLHLFDSSQPDFDWSSEDVREEFRSILRFWLDRGVDGFRVDVAHGLVKQEGLPDQASSAAASMAGGDEPPFFGQDGVHEIYRDWRALVDGYPGEPVLAAEAWLPTPERTALWVRPDEMHQAFNFPYLMAPWSADAVRDVIDESIAAFGAVGAPATWVLSNHDVVRHASRLALTFDNPQGHGIGPRSPARPDPELGLRRARAATAMMLGLPGSAYLYQGEELGLPEVIDLPDDARRDPTWSRTAGERYGRDGCRVPIPWAATAPAYGFSETGAAWLPQPVEWAALARDRQQGDPASTLELYRRLLAERRARALGEGGLEWLDGTDDVLVYRNADVVVATNFGDTDARLPAGELILASGPVGDGVLPGATTVWLSAGTA